MYEPGCGRLQDVTLLDLITYLNRDGRAVPNDNAVLRLLNGTNLCPKGRSD